jgi:hypothetical protein
VIGCPERLERSTSSGEWGRRTGPIRRPVRCVGTPAGQRGVWGQKVAIPRPRVRTREGEEVPLDDNALRWAASGLLKAGKKFRRAKGYRELEVFHAAPLATHHCARFTHEHR